jgi:hypothetical protein
MEKIIKARIEKTRKIYVHNDLSDAADFFKQVIDHKIKTDARDALLFYQMACAVMLAFTFEAKINFLGHKCLQQKWREKQ